MSTTIPDKFKILNSSMLKTIAVVTMFIDHFALVVLYWGILYPNIPIMEGTDLYKVYEIYQVCRFIGRFAFPIFCFLLIEGFIHTSNRKKYAIRLAIFAVLSELPFNLAVDNQLFSLEYQNVFFTLLIGLLTIWAMESLEHIYPIFMWLPALAGCGVAYLIRCDYDYQGILLIVILYLFRHYRLLQAAAGALSLYWEWPAMLSFIPILMYNGKKGWNMKYFTYAFYPAHLLILYIISRVIQ